MRIGGKGTVQLKRRLSDDRLFSVGTTPGHPGHHVAMYTPKEEKIIFGTELAMSYVAVTLVVTLVYITSVVLPSVTPSTVTASPSWR